LIIGDIIGRVAGTFTFAFALIKEDFVLIKQVTFKEICRSFSRYRHFFIYGSGSSLLNSAGLQLPALFLAWSYDPKVAGWFALSQRILGAPLHLVGVSVGQVYLSEAARLAHIDTRKVKDLFNRMAKKLLLYGALPLIILGILGPLTFELIFGKGWGESGYYILILFPMSLGQFVISPLSQTAVIFEKQGTQLFLDLLRVLIVVSTLTLPKLMSLSHYITIMLYSLGMFVVYTISYFFYRNIIFNNATIQAN
jgi:O-antigen/teichoic acid export membrane protein